MSEEKLQQLERKIGIRIRTTRRSKSRFAYEYRYFAVALAVLAATNTFLVAMSKFGADPLPVFAVGALIVSALLTVLATWQSAINPKDKFVKNADALNEIIDLRERLAWRKLDTANPTTDGEVDNLFEAFRKLEKDFFSSLAKTSIQDAE